MSKSSKTYHHGDLRNTLIETGTLMLAEEGAHTLSLRKLAARAGVSHNAPYMHFKDKDALLAALAEAGFLELTRRFSAAVAAAAGDWQTQFEAGGGAYVQFALDNPNQLQIMIRHFDTAQYPGLSSAAYGSLEQLQLLIEAGQASGDVKTGDSLELATLTWVLMQGLATILVGDKMPRAVHKGQSAETLTTRFLQLLLDGLRP